MRIPWKRRRELRCPLCGALFDPATDERHPVLFGEYDAQGWRRGTRVCSSHVNDPRVALTWHD